MSHSSSDFDGSQEKALSETMKKLLGEYPDGKLNVNDEGALAMVVGVENGRVRLEFPKSVKWIAFTGDEAVALAQLLWHHAKRAGVTKPITFDLSK